MFLNAFDERVVGTFYVCSKKYMRLVWKRGNWAQPKGYNLDMRGSDALKWL